MAAYQTRSASTQGMSTSCLIAMPTGVSSGDLLIASIIIDENDATIDGLSNDEGFTVFHDEFIDQGGTQYHWVLMWKRASGAEGTLDVSRTNSNFHDGYIARFNGVYAIGTPFEYAVSSQTTSATHTAPSVNSTYSNSLQVYIGVEDNYASWTTASGFTEHFDGGANFQGTLQSKALSATGATGTVSSDTGAGAGQSINLLIFDTSPAGGGGGTAVPVFLHNLRQQGIA